MHPPAIGYVRAAFRALPGRKLPNRSTTRAEVRRGRGRFVERFHGFAGLGRHACAAGKASVLRRIAPTVVVCSALTACVGEPRRFVFEPPTNGAVPAYQLVVETVGMRYSFLRPAGEPEIPAHPRSGVVFEGAPVVSGFYLEEESTEDLHVFRLVNEDGRRGRAEFRLGPHNTSLKIRPEEPSGARIVARLGPMAGPAYGLADQGGSGDVSRIGELRVENDGGHDRFVSTFTIYPQRAFGQVLISRQQERLVGDTSRNVPHFVSLTATQTALGIEGVAEVGAIVYFFGDPPRIYREFKTARTRAGYADVRPNARLFGVGWEAWPLLGWNTSARTVRASVQGFLDRGYPLSWVTVGSGFWEHGGTTTGFGRWNTDPDKYPDPTGFVQWFRDRDIALLLGLRTQFVDGMGVNTGAGRDGDDGAYVDGAEAPPEYEQGMEAGMFATLRNGTLFQSRSEVFPKWDSSLAVLDSTRQGPVDWFRRGTARWGARRLEGRHDADGTGAHLSRRSLESDHGGVAPPRRSGHGTQCIRRFTRLGAAVERHRRRGSADPAVGSGVRGPAESRTCTPTSWATVNGTTRGTWSATRSCKRRRRRWVWEWNPGGTTTRWRPASCGLCVGARVIGLTSTAPR